jgi:hypothetical protein
MSPPTLELDDAFERVFVSVSDSGLGSRVLAGTFGLAMVSAAGVSLWLINRVVTWKATWLLAAVLIPLWGEIISLFTRLGYVRVSRKGLVIVRWWRRFEMSTGEVRSVSSHGSRLFVTGANGQTLTLEWPWYIPRLRREARATALCSRLHALLRAEAES